MSIMHPCRVSVCLCVKLCCRRVWLFFLVALPICLVGMPKLLPGDTTPSFPRATRRCSRSLSVTWKHMCALAVRVGGPIRKMRPRCVVGPKLASRLGASRLSKQNVLPGFPREEMRHSPQNERSNLEVNTSPADCVKGAISVQNSLPGCPRVAMRRGLQRLVPT